MSTIAKYVVDAKDSINFERYRPAWSNQKHSNDSTINATQGQHPDSHKRVTSSDTFITYGEKAPDGVGKLQEGVLKFDKSSVKGISQGYVVMKEGDVYCDFESGNIIRRPRGSPALLVPANKVELSERIFAHACSSLARDLARKARTIADSKPFEGEIDFAFMQLDHEGYRHTDIRKIFVETTKGEARKMQKMTNSIKNYYKFLNGTQKKIDRRVRNWHRKFGAYVILNGARSNFCSIEGRPSHAGDITTVIDSKASGSSLKKANRESPEFYQACRKIKAQMREIIEPEFGSNYSVRMEGEKIKITGARASDFLLLPQEQIISQLIVRNGHTQMNSKGELETIVQGGHTYTVLHQDKYSDLDPDVFIAVEEVLPPSIPEAHKWLVDAGFTVIDEDEHGNEISYNSEVITISNIATLNNREFFMMAKDVDEESYKYVIEHNYDAHVLNIEHPEMMPTLEEFKTNYDIVCTPGIILDNSIREEIEAVMGPVNYNKAAIIKCPADTNYPITEICLHLQNQALIENFMPMTAEGTREFFALYEDGYPRYTTMMNYDPNTALKILNASFTNEDELVKKSYEDALAAEGIIVPAKELEATEKRIEVFSSLEADVNNENILLIAKRAAITNAFRHEIMHAYGVEVEEAIKQGEYLKAQRPLEVERAAMITQTILCDKNTPADVVQLSDEYPLGHVYNEYLKQINSKHALNDYDFESTVRDSTIGEDFNLPYQRSESSEEDDETDIYRPMRALVKNPYYHITDDGNVYNARYGDILDRISGNEGVAVLEPEAFAEMSATRRFYTIMSVLDDFADNHYAVKKHYYPTTACPAKYNCPVGLFAQFEHVAKLESSRSKLGDFEPKVEPDYHGIHYMAHHTMETSMGASHAFLTPDEIPPLITNNATERYIEVVKYLQEVMRANAIASIPVMIYHHGGLNYYWDWWRPIENLDLGATNNTHRLRVDHYTPMDYPSDVQMQHLIKVLTGDETPEDATAIVDFSSEASMMFDIEQTDPKVNIARVPVKRDFSRTFTPLINDDKTCAKCGKYHANVYHPHYTMIEVERQDFIHRDKIDIGDRPRLFRDDLKSVEKTEFYPKLKYCAAEPHEIWNDALPVLHQFARPDDLAKIFALIKKRGDPRRFEKISKVFSSLRLLGETLLTNEDVNRVNIRQHMSQLVTYEEIITNAAKELFTDDAVTTPAKDLLTRFDVNLDFRAEIRRFVTQLRSQRRLTRRLHNTSCDASDILREETFIVTSLTLEHTCRIAASQVQSGRKCFVNLPAYYLLLGSAATLGDKMSLTCVDAIKRLKTGEYIVEDDDDEEDEGGDYSDDDCLSCDRVATTSTSCTREMEEEWAKNGYTAWFSSGYPKIEVLEEQRTGRSRRPRITNELIFG